MRPLVKFLDAHLLERIVSRAFDVLHRVGILVENLEAATLLLDSGCKVHNNRILIPQTLVENCLKTVPNEIVVHDRHGNPALFLQQERIHFDPGSAALRILDWQTQKERKAVTQDLIDFVRLTDALPNFTAQSTGLISTDVPEEIADRYRLLIGLLYSSKPIVTGTFAVTAFSIMREMLVTVRGSTAQLKQKPLAIFDCCPSPPLKWSHLTCQALLDCARSGIPAEFVSMPLTGGTSPATLTGALVQHTAETLSGVVIGQLAHSGAPLIYGGSPAAMDMRTGTTPMGAIETMMIDSAYAQIGKHLKMPTHAYMALSDAKVLDAQAGFETGMGAVMAALSGINVISGPGMLDFESCQSLEKLVVDHEICGMALRLAAGIQARTENLAEDLYGDLDDGELFLGSPTTLRWIREEIHLPGDVIDRDNYETRQLKGEFTIGERAHRRVQEILQSQPVNKLNVELHDELVKIVTADAQNYGMDRLPL